MFCDLVGSTALSEQLDPEELREVVQAYQATCEGVIVQVDGYIARYTGDGLLVYFGYPAAHEDAAARAVRAGLAIVGELPQLNARLQERLPVLQHRPLQVQIGVHSGLRWLALLAGAYGKVGQAEEGLSVLAEALAHVEKSGERYYEVELYRLKGELLLTQEGHRLQAIGYREKTEEAEACFHKAIDIARKQQAKSLELRATVSLARLWQQQGKNDEARQMLVEIYHWFTEGFDTKDLQEAKALLEELKH